MTARIIDGARIGREIQQEVRLEVDALKRQGVQPGLGGGPGRRQSCLSGICSETRSRLARLSVSTAVNSAGQGVFDAGTAQHVEALNGDEAIDGIPGAAPAATSD